MAEPIVSKRCSTCKTDKPTSEFHKNRSTKSGFASECKSCCATGSSRRYKRGGKEKGRDRYRQNIQSPEGAATQAWYRILSRIKNHPVYSVVEIRLTKEEFLEWAIPAYKKFFHDHPGVKPSVDRKDGAGHYEIGNLQIIPHAENAAKHKGNLNAELPEGFKRCGRCKQALPFSAFGSVKPGSKGTFGLRGWCKECYRAHDRERWPKRKR